MESTEINTTTPVKLKRILTHFNLHHKKNGIQGRTLVYSHWTNWHNVFMPVSPLKNIFAYLKFDVYDVEIKFMFSNIYYNHNTVKCMKQITKNPNLIFTSSKHLKASLANWRITDTVKNCFPKPYYLLVVIPFDCSG